MWTFLAALLLLTGCFNKDEKAVYNEFKDTNNDKSFWMAFLINLCIVAMNLFYRGYLQNCVSRDSLTKTIERVTSGFNVPLFIILMLAL